MLGFKDYLIQKLYRVPPTKSLPCPSPDFLLTCFVSDQKDGQPGQENLVKDHKDKESNTPQPKPKNSIHRLTTEFVPNSSIRKPRETKMQDLRDMKQDQLLTYLIIAKEFNSSQPDPQAMDKFIAPYAAEYKRRTLLAQPLKKSHKKT